MDDRELAWRQWQELFRRRDLFALGVILPICVYIVFVGYPVAYTVYLSFCQWDGFSKIVKYVGLLNYQHLIEDPDFWTALQNTIAWTIGTLLFSNVLAFVLAVALRSRLVYFGRTIKILFFVPITMSLVATGLMFSFIVTPAFGALWEVARLLGFSNGPDLLGNPHTALYALIVVFGWSYLGIPLMLYEAGLTQIPDELYEAARLDGANGFQQMWMITLPMLRPIFMVVTILATIEAIRAFDLVLVMTRGGPGHASDTLGYFMWVESFHKRHIGYGAAISVVLLLLSSAFSIAYIRRTGKDALGGGG
jgi:raffinose/stachyose/melibiose transport system permease protein